jgi:hypothetical protein
MDLPWCRADWFREIFIEEGFQSVSKNLGNQFIVEISETNSPKLIDFRRVIYFGYEGM